MIVGNKRLKPSKEAMHAEIALRYGAAKRAAKEANKGRQKAPFLSLRLSELERLARYSFGANVPDTSSGRAAITAMLEYVARINGREVALQWIHSRAPWASREAAAMVERAIDAKVQTADELAWRIGLSWQDRSRLRIRTIGAVGTTTQTRKGLRKAANTKAKADLRRAAGAMPRAQYEAQSKSQNQPWVALGLSRATWYRRGSPSVGETKPHETSPSAIKIDITTIDDTVVSVATRAAPSAWGRALRSDDLGPVQPTLSNECGGLGVMP